MSRQKDFIQAGIAYRMEHGKPMCIAGSKLADVERDFNRVISFEAGAEYGYQYAQTHPNWISVEEELPKKRGQYFVYTAAGQSWQSELMQDKSGEWCWFCSPMAIGAIANVTHWMPIVPPRKEG